MFFFGQKHIQSEKINIGRERVKFFNTEINHHIRRAPYYFSMVRKVKFTRGDFTFLVGGKV